MSSKFGGLAANVTTPSRMIIIHPSTGKPITDKSGQKAYIDFFSQDSDVGRQHVRDRASDQVKRAQQADAGDVAGDPIEDQSALLSALAAGWNLVDPTTETAIDFPFTGKDSATELFSAPELGWLRRQGWLYVINAGNFMPGSSPN